MTDYNLLANIQYCGDIVSDSLSLLYYTHIPAAGVALLVSAYVLWNKRTRAGYFLFALSVVFAVWVTLALLIWLEFDKNTFLITAWSVFGLLTASIFFLTQLFAHAFFTSNAPFPKWMAILWSLLLLPIIVLTPTYYNVSGVDIRDCVAVENQLFTNYYYALGLIAMLLTVISAYPSLRRTSQKIEQESRSAKWIVFMGVELFLIAFLSTGALASYLVDSGLISDFGLEQYGVATMAVFIGILAYATVRYHAFNLKLLAAQALVFSLVILIAAEFLFVTSYINKVLVGLTLGLAVVFGYLLVRSVKQEVRQRELIEQQEKELEVANKQQENLLHFISHEIKGYLTKSEAGFAAIVEGDYGTVSETLKGMAGSALADVRKGVRTVMEILDASNMRKGTIGYNMQPFDVKKAITDVVNHLKPGADEKHLTIALDLPEGQCMLRGDAEKIRQHVLRNLIDNAVKYTPKGTIRVELRQKDGTIRFAVEDNGVGITPEDMKKLFTEGGHGAESIKINVHSTGYGLFIAKQVVETHKGKIWAESAGDGKGSKFIVDFPVS